MEIRYLSQNRGIISLYDGGKYIIYSTFYGVVAESTKIEREHLKREYKSENEIAENTVIDFDICQWYGYWSLKDIITRGIKKAEKQYVNKNIKINYHEVEDTDNSLNKRLKFILE